jgi:hypothetical protein
MDENRDTKAPKKRVPGIDKGKVFISDNFDDPMPDFEEAFYGMSENDSLYQPPLAGADALDDPSGASG